MLFILGMGRMMTCFQWWERAQHWHVRIILEVTDRAGPEEDRAALNQIFICVRAHSLTSNMEPFWTPVTLYCWVSVQYIPAILNTHRVVLGQGLTMSKEFAMSSKHRYERDDTLVFWQGLFISVPLNLISRAQFYYLSIIVRMRTGSSRHSLIGSFGTCACRSLMVQIQNNTVSSAPASIIHVSCVNKAARSRSQWWQVVRKIYPNLVRFQTEMKGY